MTSVSYRSFLPDNRRILQRIMSTRIWRGYSLSSLVEGEIIRFINFLQIPANIENNFEIGAFRQRHKAVGQVISGNFLDNHGRVDSPGVDSPEITVQKRRSV